VGAEGNPAEALLARPTEEQVAAATVEE